jgi:hypothetical protein
MCRGGGPLKLCLVWIFIRSSPGELNELVRRKIAISLSGPDALVTK